MAEATFDIGPLVRKVVESANVAIEAGIAAKVAAQLEAMGWTCLAPGETTEYASIGVVGSRAIRAHRRWMEDRDKRIVAEVEAQILAEWRAEHEGRSATFPTRAWRDRAVVV